jgi:glycosyltransferase involved in cell wall biosynthesis
MIVAAKDEEANIGRCVEGLRTQDYLDLELIFVNDRSTDGTGGILDEAARQDQRVCALHVRRLRDGWFGKNNAMREGVERAGGRWLCFSDADCAYDSSKLLSAAMRYALTEKIDFLSVLPKLEAHTFWERVVQPVAGAVMVFWFPPQKVNSPASPRAYANGAFMLMSRDTYDAIGGHEPVRTQVNEDMHMARLAKQAGRRLRVVRSQGLYRVRMYTGFREIWRGWSRIFYGCFGTLPRLLISVAFLSLFSLSPYLTLLAAPLTGAAWPAFSLAALAAIVSQQSVLWRFWALSEIRPAWALTYPIGAAICLGMTFSAITRLGGVRATTWRGTTYRGNELADTEATEEIAEPALPLASPKGPPPAA